MSLPRRTKLGECCTSSKGSCTCLTNQIFQPLYRALMRPHLEYAIQGNRPYLKKDTYHLERIQQTATRCAKGLKELSYEESLRELKLQSLEKRRIRNDLVQTHNIMFHQIDLETSKLLKISRRSGVRRSSLRLLQQPGRTRLSIQTIYQRHNYGKSCNGGRDFSIQRHF